MRSPTCSTDLSEPLAADASVVINLISTGIAARIVRALPSRLMVVDVVCEELEAGQGRGHQHSDHLGELVATKVIEIVKLDEYSELLFEKLVVGPAADTLDDGEAATIAYAVRSGGTAFVDERKATRICATRFPGLCVGCTMDLLLHPDLQHRLGENGVGDAIFNALRFGRMRVLAHHLPRVVGLIGPERAAICQSLPRSIRTALRE